MTVEGMTPGHSLRLRDTVARVAIGLILIAFADAFSMTARLNALDLAPAANDKNSPVAGRAPVEDNKSHSVIPDPVEGEKFRSGTGAIVSRGEAFHPVGAPRTFATAPGVVESTFEMTRGPSPFDRIGLHRLTLTPLKSNSDRALEPAQQADSRQPLAALEALQMLRPQSSRRTGIVMLYLPGTNMNGVVAVDDPRYS